MFRLSTLSAFCLLSLSIVSATTAHAASQRMVINYKGTGTAISKVVPNTLSVGPNANGLLEANCFEADIFDLQSGELLHYLSLLRLARIQPGAAESGKSPVGSNC